MKKTKVRTSKILLWVVSAALVAILSVSLAFMGVALNRTKNLYKTDFQTLPGSQAKPCCSSATVWAKTILKRRKRITAKGRSCARSGQTGS